MKLGKLSICPLVAICASSGGASADPAPQPPPSQPVIAPVTDAAAAPSCIAPLQEEVNSVCGGLFRGEEALRENLARDAIANSKALTPFRVKSEIMLKGYDTAEILLSCKGNGESATGLVPPLGVVRTVCGYVKQANEELATIHIDCSSAPLRDRVNCELVRAAWTYFGPKAVKGGNAMYRDLHCAELEDCLSGG